MVPRVAHGALIDGILLQHPFHCLPTIFALKNISSRESSTTDVYSRSEGAKAIFHHVYTGGDNAKRRVTQLEVIYFDRIASLV